MFEPNNGYSMLLIVAISPKKFKISQKSLLFPKNLYFSTKISTFPLESPISTLFHFCLEITPLFPKLQQPTNFSLDPFTFSPSYMAPEILSHKPYGKPVDMWALGVIAYIILGGYPPFDQDDEDSVKACKYEFHTDYWSHVSPHAKQFIQGLITLDPKARLTVDDALNHIWVKTAARDLAGRNLAQSLKKFKEFNSKRKLKGAIKGVMLANRLRNSVHALSEGR